MIFPSRTWAGSAQHTHGIYNNQSGEANVKARLDRAFANEEFRQIFQHTRVGHLPSVESDHCFVVTEFHTSFSERMRNKKQFRYENVWQTHADYDLLVADTWRGIQRVPGLRGISNALGTLQATLEPWGSKEFGSLTRTVRNL